MVGTFNESTLILPDNKWVALWNNCILVVCSVALHTKNDVYIYELSNSKKINHQYRFEYGKQLINCRSFILGACIHSNDNRFQFEYLKAPQNECFFLSSVYNLSVWLLSHSIFHLWVWTDLFFTAHSTTTTITTAMTTTTTTTTSTTAPTHIQATLTCIVCVVGLFIIIWYEHWIIMKNASIHTHFNNMNIYSFALFVIYWERIQTMLVCWTPFSYCTVYRTECGNNVTSFEWMNRLLNIIRNWWRPSIDIMFYFRHLHFSQLITNWIEIKIAIDWFI